MPRHRPDLTGHYPHASLKRIGFRCETCKAPAVYAVTLYDSIGRPTPVTNACARHAETIADAWHKMAERKGWTACTDCCGIEPWPREREEAGDARE